MKDIKNKIQLIISQISVLIIHYITKYYKNTLSVNRLELDA